jgi:drug/metabolite transporter (DMT)-like permease
MLWTTLVSLYLFANVSYTLLLKSSPLPKANRHIAHLLITIAMGLSAFVAMLLGHGDWSPDGIVWWLLLMQAVFFFGVNQLNIVALNHLDASIFTIIQSFRIVIVTILGILLVGDNPTPLEMIGGGFIFTSILVLKLHKDKQYFSKPILIGLAATVLMLLRKKIYLIEQLWPLFFSGHH